MYENLFSPIQLGEIFLRNRIVMAPMTRSRAMQDGVPTPEMGDYYKQRAGAGMIVSEGTQPSFDGQGYARTPGIHTNQQQILWKGITEQVETAGSGMVVQLMHVGRISHRNNKIDGARTVAPSAIKAKGSIYTDKAGMQPFDEPEEMSLTDIQNTISDYAEAASVAMEAGFMGVEIHATSGYLPSQFLSTGTNKRTDKYGGKCFNRIRFLIDVIEAISNVITTTRRIGVRICPGNPFNDLHDENPKETFSTLLQTLSNYDLAYLHVIRMPSTGIDNFALAKQYFKGSLVFNDSFNAEEANKFISEKLCDAVSFGRPFIANPDFPDRIRLSQSKLDYERMLAEFNPKLLYTPGPVGYSDYPKLH